MMFQYSMFLSIVLLLGCGVVQAVEEPQSTGLAEPTTRPVPRPSEVEITLPSKVSKRGEFPVTVTLRYDSDDTRLLNNHSFEFLLLDEAGRQVAVDPFYREANFIDVVLAGRQPTYKPRIGFDPYCKRLVVGKKYQLITLVPAYRLASSAWFTLID